MNKGGHTASGHFTQNSRWQPAAILDSAAHSYKPFSQGYPCVIHEKQANDLSVIKDALAFKLHIYKIVTFRGPGAQNGDPKPKFLQLI